MNSILFIHLLDVFISLCVCVCIYIYICINNANIIIKFEQVYSTHVSAHYERKRMRKWFERSGIKYKWKFCNIHTCIIVSRLTLCLLRYTHSRFCISLFTPKWARALPESETRSNGTEKKKDEHGKKPSQNNFYILVKTEYVIFCKLAEKEKLIQILH